jgi:hypothetical protein
VYYKVVSCASNSKESSRIDDIIKSGSESFCAKSRD